MGWKINIEIEKEIITKKEQKINFLYKIIIPPF